MELVNGYVCRDCTDVALAKRQIDPAHPKDGPNGRDARTADNADEGRPPAVLFGGTLGQPASGVERVQPTPFAPGASFNLKV
jgi:hypothetical protein